MVHEKFASFCMESDPRNWVTKCGWNWVCSGIRSTLFSKVRTCHQIQRSAESVKAFESESVAVIKLVVCKSRWTRQCSFDVLL